MKAETALIIGGGAIGVEHHFPRLRRLVGCSHITIMEPSDSRRSHLITDFKGDAQVHLVAEAPSATFDIVVIATPPKFHMSYVRQYVASAGTIIVEKPVGLTADECRTIRDDASQHSTAVYVPMIRRTLPGYELLRGLLQSGRFGPIVRVSASEGGVFSWGAVSLGSFSHDLNGGGVLMDTGPHTLDLLLQLFGEMQCTSAWMDGFKPAVEANCELHLTSHAGVDITLLLSRNRNLACEIRIETEKAELAIGIRSNRISVREVEGGEYEIFPTGLSSYDDPGFADLFDDWYRTFPMSNNNTGVGPDEALQLAEISDQAYSIAQPIKGGF
jgi:predicted dehydrogenase